MAEHPSLWRRRCLITLAMLGASLIDHTIAADPPAGKSALPVLHLANHDYVAGVLVDTPDGRELHWQSPVFSSPMSFGFDAINAVHFPVPPQMPPSVGESRFELLGGDELFGKLVALDDKIAVIDVPELGELRLERTWLQRMSRWGNGAKLVYFGPTGLNGWKQIGEPNHWREEAGHLLTQHAGAAIYRDFDAPTQARYEVELAWDGKPDFELSLGVGPDTVSTLRAFHIAVWDEDIIAARETEREADVASLMKTNAAAGHLHLVIYIDRKLGRMLVYSPMNEPLAEIVAETNKADLSGGVQLTNRIGNVRLKRLHIARWDGKAPKSADGNKSRVHSHSGDVIYGGVQKLDAERRAIVLDISGEEKLIPLDEIQDVHFAPPETIPDRAVKAVALNGLSLSGSVQKVEGPALWLKHPGIETPLKLPIASLQTLISLTPPTPPVAPTGRPGRLEAEGTLLNGSLVEAKEGGASCLVWRPMGATQPASIRREIAARIIYRDPPPPPPKNANARQVQVQARVVQPAPGFVNQLANLFNGNGQAVAPPVAAGVAAPATYVLHLRSGDTIPCSAANIDERGVTYKSSVSTATFIPHEQIKVLELAPRISAGQIAKSKKDRLLTLPRMQRDSPPTQLLRSLDGDYLRGRVVAMDDKVVQVEVRLETRKIPRNQVARMIWLHADEMDGATPALPASESNGGTRVQSLPADGNRLTFFAEQLEGTTLSGQSPLLGKCTVDLLQVDQLVLGPAIEQTASSLAFHQWKLKNAPDPLEAPADGGSGSEGLESVLVGKPAPEFELDLLTGEKFRLANEKGKIVVLDFWASWCGPCLQAMPQVDRVTTEYADRGVILVAVNLEETPEKVKAALERLKLDTAVALDRNGRIAEKYGATAIPQTVIIDRDGVVARLFVGGGARFDDQLRAALDSVLAGAPPKSE